MYFCLTLMTLSNRQDRLVFLFWEPKKRSLRVKPVAKSHCQAVTEPGLEPSSYLLGADCMGCCGYRDEKQRHLPLWSLRESSRNPSFPQGWSASGTQSCSQESPTPTLEGDENVPQLSLTSLSYPLHLSFSFFI